MIATVGMKTVGTVTSGGEAAATGAEYSAAILLRGPFARRVLRQQGYLALGFLFGLANFLLMTVIIVLGTTWLLVLLGVPVLVFGFVMLRKYAERERRRIHRLTGVKIPSPYREMPSGGLLSRLQHQVADPASWRDLMHLVVASPLALGWFIAVVLAWTLPLGALSLPFWYSALPNHRVPIAHSGDRQIYINDMSGILVLCAAVFVFVWLVTPMLLELAIRIQTGVGHGLLGLSRGELERREVALRVTRGQAVSAAEAERRRIERDLHDGAQQRLVALAMDLGMAKAKLSAGDDTDTAARLVAEAHEGVKLALTELRDLARGIHPAVLTDRGLDAALSALAGRSPIPVEVDAALSWRPSPEIESAAYFVASECLANMAKHSEATRAWIELDYVNKHLRLVVGDNGIGGAQANERGGLNGLADRIAPLDGILSVSSPIGGPTLIVMEIPCEAPKA
jgi:signal transduction histidine kinase